MTQPSRPASPAVAPRASLDAFSTAPTGLAVPEPGARHDTAPEAVAPQAPGNPIAIVSLISGAAGFMPPVWFGSALCITAITTGIIGLLRTSDRSGRRGRLFAIFGMALGFSFLPIQACLFYMRR